MKTVRTANQLLTLFSRERPTITVSGAASHFGLRASTVSRLLAAMATSGLIQKGPDRAYRPGPLSYVLGLLYHSQNQLADQVNSGARRIVNETGFSCWTSVLTGDQALLISHFSGVDLGFVDAGNLLPAHASAGGKALLARMSDGQVEEILASSHLIPWTAKTKTEIEIILSDIREIRQRGWSIVVDELFEGVTSVGAALCPAGGATPMALSISTHGARRSVPLVAGAVHHLIAVMREIGGMVVDPFWTDRPDPTQESTELAIKAYLSRRAHVVVSKGASDRHNETMLRDPSR